jgi:single-strand DNA-binding protein
VLACPPPRPQAPPTNPAPEPATAGSPIQTRPTSLAPLLAPGGLQACHGVHRPPGPRAGQTARPRNRRGAACQGQPSASPATSPNDPEVRYTDSGIARATFWVAVSGRREQEASFFTVIVWRDQAEHAAESLSEGSRVVVVGRLQQRTWSTEDGSARQVVEVVAEELGPGLRWAIATPVKATRSASG